MHTALKLEWLSGLRRDVQNQLTEQEKFITSNILSVKKIDLDSGASLTNEAQSLDDANWFYTTFSLSDADIQSLSNVSYASLDFGLFANLRKVSIYLDGVEIGKSNNYGSECTFVIPSSMLFDNRSHSLVAVVTDSVQLQTWIKGRGMELHTPEGFISMLHELPSSVQLIAKDQLGRVTSLRREESKILIDFESGSHGVLQAWSQGVFRFTLNQTSDPIQQPLIDELCLDELGEHLQEGEWGGIEELYGGYTINFQNLIVQIVSEPFCLTVLDSQERMLFRQHSSGLVNGQVVGAAIDLAPDEHIFGLGKNATPTMDKRGHREDIWVNHDWITCDIPVPFYISTQGYGLYLNNSYHAVFDMGKLVPNQAIAWAMGGKLDYFFLYGPEPKQIVSSYTAITGRSKMIPRWTFGYMQSKTGIDTTELAINTIQKFKQDDIPIDVYCIDPAWQNDMCDLQWDPNNFPDPALFMDFLKENDIKLMLWTTPFVNQSCNKFEEGVHESFFCVDKEGAFYPIVWWKGFGAGLLDFTQPLAVDWWREQLRPLLEIGVEALKIDGGDGGEVPATIYNADGRSGSELHNLYPVYFAKSIYESMLKERPNVRPVVWERTGFVGSGKYPCSWGGDQNGDFEGTRVLIKAGQGAGLIGIPFWSHDMGGFGECPGMTEEYLLRSFQWGLWSPLSRAHGPRSNPWAYSEAATSIVRDMIKLRYRLLPYLYGLSYETVQTGIPMMRAMLLEYPSDPESYKADYQYFLGSSFLVAPIYEESGHEQYTSVRDIYLPEGEWIDYWTEEIFQGAQTIRYEATRDIIPLFVRKGAIIPYIEQINNTVDYRGDRFEIHLYPSENETNFDLYHDDGLSLDYKQGAYDLIRLSCRKVKDQVIVALTTEHHGILNENPTIEFNFIVHDSEMTYPPLTIPFQKGTNHEVNLTPENL
jgi:alpha-glucosidase (family GH31 glycosyl hydrolase)